MMATSSPEMTAIATKRKPISQTISEAKKDSVKRMLYVTEPKPKKKKYAEKVPVFSSDEEEEDDVEYVDTYKDMDMEEFLSIKPDRFVEMHRLPVLRDYVLVEFKLKAK